MSMPLRGPAPNPCDSCPYRRDVPAGIWAAEEYQRLPRYDRDMAYQPPHVFLCHQNEAAPGSRLCAGWVGCHHPDQLLGVRLAVISGRLSGADATTTLAYTTRVPLFDSGAQAADHGLSGIDNPDPAARAAIAKIVARRPDVVTEEGH
jgi:uncharacterized protein DUF6283